MSRAIPRAFLLSLLVIPAAVQAQEPAPVVRPRAIVRPSLPFALDPAAAFADQVIVKFVEGRAVRLRDGVFQGLGADERRALAGLLGDAKVQRLFTRTEDDLDAERAALQPRLPAGEAPLADLNNYYRVTTSGAAATEALVNGLLALPCIETAYAEPRPLPLGDIPPTTPLFESGQTYLGDAPAGYAYLRFASIVGMRAPTQTIAQLEGSWHFGHEDVDGLVTSSVIGVVPGSGYDGWRDHGTACVGILAAGRNAYGTRGLANKPKALRLSSLANGSANMISLVTAQLQAGDVMTSSYAFAGGNVHYPLDFYQADFDAVRAAANKGICYAFGAGNTNQSLDNTSIYGSRYLPASASSGGFIIGASDAGTTNRAGFSNYGTRIDANGWGSQVTTIGYGDLFNPNDVRQHYTSNFGGTSAAGPAVAAVIASWIGAVREQNGVTLTVEQVRTALRTTGTPVNSNVGTRPDLERLLAMQSLPDGLLVTQDGAPGGAFTYEVRGNPGEQYAAVLSAARARVALGVNRPLLVDPATLLLLGQGTLPAAGVRSVTVPIPNDPSLKDLDVYLQAAFVRGGLHLSNSAELWVK